MILKLAVNLFEYLIDIYGYSAGFYCLCTKSAYHKSVGWVTPYPHLYFCLKSHISYVRKRIIIAFPCQVPHAYLHRFTSYHQTQRQIKQKYSRHIIMSHYAKENKESCILFEVLLLYIVTCGLKAATCPSGHVPVVTRNAPLLWVLMELLKTYPR
jgi:hypothetical protein